MNLSFTHCRSNIVGLRREKDRKTHTASTILWHDVNQLDDRELVWTTDMSVGGFVLNFLLGNCDDNFLHIQGGSVLRKRRIDFPSTSIVCPTFSIKSLAIFSFSLFSFSFVVSLSQLKDNLILYDNKSDTTFDFTGRRVKKELVLMNSSDLPSYIPLISLFLVIFFFNCH